ncbi:MAG TPA: hypothetical protein VMV70_00590 [Gallionella sp.]|nr:hypothetical protein [Gallionella sp.]
MNTKTLIGSAVNAAMTTKQILIVPGKNPDPGKALRSKLRWRTCRSAAPSVSRNAEHSLPDYHDYAEERNNPKRPYGSFAIISGVFANMRKQI